ncbi:MAG: FtsQ-type POTRA domain-containing protein [Deltaproteobacteria bacterium]|nr:FtsQ-type POTRA domain-containing protein [Deltaproteobacteria bacterium]
MASKAWWLICLSCLLVFGGSVVVFRFLGAKQPVSDGSVIEGVRGESEASSERVGIERFKRSFLDGGLKVLGRLLAVSPPRIQGNYYLSEADIISAVGLNRQLWIWQYWRSDVRKALMEHSWIQEATFEWRIYPLELLLNIKEEEPWLVAEFANTTWLISRSSKTLQPLRSLRDSELIVITSNLPRLDGIDVGADMEKRASRTEKRLNEALNLLRLFRIAGDFPFEIERFTLLEDSGVLVTPIDARTKPKLIVTANTFSDAKAILENIKVVLGDLEKRGEHADTIDLRFKGQAIVQPTAINP